MRVTETMMAAGSIRRTVTMVILLPLVLAAGCKNFFTPVNGTTTGTTTPTNTGDYAYIASVNTASASDPIYTLSGLSIAATGTLTELTGFPIVLPFPPAMVAINAANTLLYVAGSQVIYGYSISTSGALTKILSATQTQPLANANIVAMTISPDGQWLLALDAANTIVTVDEFKIASTGLLTAEASTQYALTNGATIVPNAIAIAPTGNYVAVALGTGADVLFGFNTNTGALTEQTQINPPSASSADQAVTFDSTGQTLYIARSGTDGGVVPYTIGSGGVLTLVAGSPFALGTNATGPSSILIDATGKYLYVGNKTSSTISGFSIGSAGVLTALTGSPYATGTSVSALGRDNTGKYLLATAINGGPDVQAYSFDATTPGQLDPLAYALVGDPTEPAGAVAIALMH